MHFVLALLAALSAAGFAPSASAFGYIAPEVLEADVIECSGKVPNTFQCARGIERKVLNSRKTIAHRHENQLNLYLKGNTVSFVDNLTDDDTTSVSYSYLGFEHKINGHILHVQYYEGDAYLLVNQHSGRRTFISGYPLLSPDGKHFLSLSEDMFAGYKPNNIELWQVQSDKYQRLAVYAPDWGPHSGIWKNNRQAQIEKRCFSPVEKDPAALKPCGVAKVDNVDSVWRLVE